MRLTPLLAAIVIWCLVHDARAEGPNRLVDPIGEVRAVRLDYETPTVNRVEFGVVKRDHLQGPKVLIIVDVVYTDSVIPQRGDILMPSWTQGATLVPVKVLRVDATGDFGAPGYDRIKRDGVQRLQIQGTYFLP